MTGLTRRLFLSRGSLTVVAAGVASALPAVVTTAEAEAPATEPLIDDAATLDGPLIAQVTDLRAGAISLFSGENEVKILDKVLAARLFNAAK